jgi:hypothetical protein
VVIAVPVLFVIQGHHKQVRLLQMLKHGLAAVLSSHRIAEQGAELIQDGCLQ